MKRRFATMVRFTRRSLLLCGVVLLLLQSALAQAAAQTPASVVLVLKLVSATHVRPTTGVVISNDGLVIVAADFVSAGDEIVVMDGGTDILSHARPARTVKRSVADGLAVLSVAGLSRPAIRLSPTATLASSALHFTAFPPAEKLAEGAPPLWLPVKLQLDNSSSQLVLSAATALPNVSGVIVDECGQLAGLNLAQGAQSLDTDKAPALLIGAALGRALSAMQISLLPGSCTGTGQPVPEPLDMSDMQATVPPEPAVADKPVATVADVDEPASKKLTVAEPTGNTEQSNTDNMPVVARSSPSIITLVPLWLWLVGLLVLAALVIKAVMFLRIVKSPAILASDEPDTAQLRAGTDRSTLESKTADGQLPDINNLPEGFDAMLIIEGQAGDDNDFSRFCLVKQSQFDVIIGRGDADIAINAGSISRHHVRLRGDGKVITLSDLGSSNGSFIRNIPCLPGEIMYVEPGDDVLLGDVRFRIRLLTSDGTAS